MTPVNPLCDPTARLIIAHRGNTAAAPENTIESLSQAVEIGADAVEFDVRMSRDGTAVVMHDPVLDRTTNGHGRVDAYTFDELRTLDAGARSTTAKGQRSLIPSLEEVLDRFPETPMVIEVKEVGAVDITEKLIRRFGAENRVVIGSLETAVTEHFYRSGLRTCASMRDASRMIAVALAGFAPGKPRYDVLSITPRYLGLPIPVLSMAAAARKAGVATQVWTINDPIRATALWSGGVAGIVTDDPAALVRARPQ